MILSPRFGLFFKGLPVVFQLIIGTQCNRDLTLQIIFSLNITVRCCGLKICNIMKDRWGTISNMHKIWWLDPCCMLGLEEKYLILNNNLIQFYILSGQWWMWELKVFPQIPAEARITAFRWVFFCNCSRKKAKDIWFTVTSDKEMQQIFSPLKNQQMISLVFSWNITQRLTDQSIGLLWYWYLHWNCLRNLECCATIQYRVFHLFEMQPCYIPAAPRTPECNLSVFFYYTSHLKHINIIKSTQVG